MMYKTIREFVTEFPDKPRFKIFRVSDKYFFTVKEVKEDTVILNTNVNLEVDIDTEDYLVHESEFGLDFTLPKIFKYSPYALDKPVEALNFRKELTTRLHNNKVWKYGRLIKESFYPFKEDLVTVDFDDLILEVTYDYTFHPVTKEVKYRLEHIKWYNDLGEVVFDKPQPKLYEGHEGMREAKTRRANIINLLKHDLDVMSKSGGGAGSAYVGQLIAEIDPYIKLYIDYGMFTMLQVLDASINPILSSFVAPNVSALAYMHMKLDFLSAESANPNLYKGSLL